MRICNFREVTLDYFKITSGGFSQFITILHGRGVFPIYYNRGGGVYRDPKFVLRNKWTAPNRLIFRAGTMVLIKTHLRHFANNFYSLNHQVVNYDLSTFVGDIGGTLGLFVGFSFFGLWDIIEYLLAFVKKIISGFQRPRPISLPSFPRVIEKK